MANSIGPKGKVPELVMPPLLSNAINDKEFQAVIQKRYCAGAVPEACKVVYCEECMFYKTNLNAFIKWKKEVGGG